MPDTQRVIIATSSAPGTPATHQTVPWQTNGGCWVRITHVSTLDGHLWELHKANETIIITHTLWSENPTCVVGCRAYHSLLHEFKVYFRPNEQTSTFRKFFAGGGSPTRSPILGESIPTRPANATVKSPASFPIR